MKKAFLSSLLLSMTFVGGKSVSQAQVIREQSEHRLRSDVLWKDVTCENFRTTTTMDYQAEVMQTAHIKLDELSGIRGDFSVVYFSGGAVVNSIEENQGDNVIHRLSWGKERSQEKTEDAMPRGNWNEYHHFDTGETICGLFLKRKPTHKTDIVNFVGDGNVQISCDQWQKPGRVEPAFYKDKSLSSGGCGYQEIQAPTVPILDIPFTDNPNFSRLRCFKAYRTLPLEDLVENWLAVNAAKKPPLGQEHLKCDEERAGIDDKTLMFDKSGNAITKIVRGQPVEISDLKEIAIGEVQKALGDYVKFDIRYVNEENFGNEVVGKPKASEVPE